MTLQKCPLCRERRPKRTCPALGQTICTVCCATKRLVEIACPSDCTYLSAARSHPPAVVQKRQDRDLGFLMSMAGELTDTQYRLAVLLQSVIVKHAEGAMPRLEDVDIAEGAAAAASTLETAGKGIIYEHQAVSVPAQRLTQEFRTVVADLLARNPSQQARIERDTAVALRRIERGARSAEAALAGDPAPAYLGVLTRVFASAPLAAKPNDLEPPQGNLIVQP